MSNYISSLTPVVIAGVWDEPISAAFEVLPGDYADLIIDTKPDGTLVTRLRGHEKPQPKRREEEPW